MSRLLPMMKRSNSVAPATGPRVLESEKQCWTEGESNGDNAPAPPPSAPLSARGIPKRARSIPSVPPLLLPRNGAVTTQNGAGETNEQGHGQQAMQSTSSTLDRGAGVSTFLSPRLLTPLSHRPSLTPRSLSLRERFFGRGSPRQGSHDVVPFDRKSDESSRRTATDEVPRVCGFEGVSDGVEVQARSDDGTDSFPSADNGTPKEVEEAKAPVVVLPKSRPGSARPSAAKRAASKLASFMSPRTTLPSPSRLRSDDSSNVLNSDSKAVPLDPAGPASSESQAPPSRQRCSLRRPFGISKKKANKDDETAKAAQPVAQVTAETAMPASSPIDMQVQSAGGREPNASSCEAGLDESNLELFAWLTRRLVDEVYEQTLSDESVLAVTQACPEVGWVAQCALSAPLPPEWRKVAGRYINSSTGETSADIPLLRWFVKMARMAIHARQSPTNAAAASSWLRTARHDALRDAAKAQEGWTQHVEPSTLSEYFYCEKTRISSWINPSSAHAYVAHVASALLQSDLFPPSHGDNETLEDVAAAIRVYSARAGSRSEQSHRVAPRDPGTYETEVTRRDRVASVDQRDLYWDGVADRPSSARDQRTTQRAMSRSNRPSAASSDSGPHERRSSRQEDRERHASKSRHEDRGMHASKSRQEDRERHASKSRQEDRERRTSRSRRGDRERHASKHTRSRSSSSDSSDNRSVSNGSDDEWLMSHRHRSDSRGKDLRTDSSQRRHRQRKAHPEPSSSRSHGLEHEQHQLQEASVSKCEQFDIFSSCDGNSPKTSTKNQAVGSSGANGANGAAAALAGAAAAVAAAAAALAGGTGQAINEDDDGNEECEAAAALTEATKLLHVATVAGAVTARAKSIDPNAAAAFSLESQSSQAGFGNDGQTIRHAVQWNGEVGVYGDCTFGKCVVAGSAEETQFLDKFLKPSLGSPHGQPSSVSADVEPAGSMDDSVVADAMACWSGAQHQAKDPSVASEVFVATPTTVMESSAEKRTGLLPTSLNVEVLVSAGPEPASVTAAPPPPRPPSPQAAGGHPQPASPPPPPPPPLSLSEGPSGLARPAPQSPPLPPPTEASSTFAQQTADSLLAPPSPESPRGHVQQNTSSSLKALSPETPRSNVREALAEAATEFDRACSSTSTPTRPSPPQGSPPLSSSLGAEQPQVMIETSAVLSSPPLDPLAIGSTALAPAAAVPNPAPVVRTGSTVAIAATRTPANGKVGVLQHSVEEKSMSDSSLLPPGPFIADGSEDTRAEESLEAARSALVPPPPPPPPMPLSSPPFFAGSSPSGPPAKLPSTRPAPLPAPSALPSMASARASTPPSTRAAPPPRPVNGVLPMGPHSTPAVENGKTATDGRAAKSREVKPAALSSPVRSVMAECRSPDANITSSPTKSPAVGGA